MSRLRTNTELPYFCWTDQSSDGKRCLGKVLGAAMLLFVFGLAGCGQSSGTNEKAKLRIGMMPKLMGISFFDAAGRGAQEAAEEIGVELVFDGPTEASAEKQAEMIDVWVAQGMDVIAVAPNDPESISKTLAKAKEQGIPTVTWDTDANPEKSQRTYFVNQAPAEGIGNALVDVMVEGTGEDGKLKGKYLIISGTTTAANQNAWMEVMLPRLKAEHPECELLEPLYPGEDQLQAQLAAIQAMHAHEDLKGIWALTSVAVPAAAKARRDISRDNVYITGLSLPSLMREYVQDGTVEKFVLFDVEALGYLTVQLAARVRHGPIETGVHDFGKLKGVEVKGSEVILGAPLIFDKDNIDQYDF